MLASAALIACSPYKIDIPQGNIIEPENVAKLRKGLTTRQVRFLLGTPAIIDTFHNERWDYVYYFRPGRGQTEKQQLTLFFEDDRLVRVEGAAPSPETVREDLRAVESSPDGESPTPPEEPLITPDGTRDGSL